MPDPRPVPPRAAPHADPGSAVTYVARAPRENLGIALLDEETQRAIADIDYLRTYDDGIYRDLDIELTLDYMRRRFVAPLSRHVAIEEASLVDCASGFGWLGFAYLLAGGKHAVLVDLDARRLDAAREIADLIGVSQRCSFLTDRIQDIAIADDGADIFASVETLEHVGRENVRPSLLNMSRIAKTAVVLTTPNFLFPAVAHDTELPFAHWLPAGLRHRYAAAAGRADLDRGNRFLRPWELAPLLPKFRPVGRFQTFATREEYDRFYPHYMPYGPRQVRRWRAAPRAGQRTLQTALARTLGAWSFALAPNLASVWVRRG
jgi:2-polyprenyl-3-methyl-5-hydroxy-6-metoxy-1,4-benzoquinol methylase